MDIMLHICVHEWQNCLPDIAVQRREERFLDQSKQRIISVYLFWTLGVTKSTCQCRKAEHHQTNDTTVCVHVFYFVHGVDKFECTRSSISSKSMVLEKKVERNTSRQMIQTHE